MSAGFFRSQLISIYTVCKGISGFSRTRVKIAGAKVETQSELALHPFENAFTLEGKDKLLMENTHVLDCSPEEEEDFV